MATATADIAGTGVVFPPTSIEIPSWRDIAAAILAPTRRPASELALVTPASPHEPGRRRDQATVDHWMALLAAE